MFVSLYIRLGFLFRFFRLKKLNSYPAQSPEYLNFMSEYIFNGNAMSVTIIPFEPQYAGSFRDLNLAWVKKYFFVEPKDRALLENCKKSIIDQGGYIYFAQYDGNIVGCFSLMKLGDKVFELGKMAVDPQFQGLKIGQQMVQFAIDLAKDKHWDKVVLYSSTKLDTALHVYRKYGFREVVLEKEPTYARSDIKMELVLREY